MALELAGVDTIAGGLGGEFFDANNRPGSIILADDPECDGTQAFGVTTSCLSGVVNAVSKARMINASSHGTEQ